MANLDRQTDSNPLHQRKSYVGYISCDRPLSKQCLIVRVNMNAEIMLARR